MKTRTRFAPSPTGFLHVGSARTALFNWLFARHTGGEFILRIEDTDKERSKKEFEEEILESLRWLGIDWDGDLVHQTSRFDIYRAYAQKLVDKDLAYADDGAIRFRSPKVLISWEDVIRGRIEIDGKLMDDLVIMKSDGSPTYNFAVVVDDGEMNITHVIRGEDHISNTPKQIPLYGALGFKQPEFAHIPLILGEDRSRLSKRHGATSIRDFKAMGYLAPAMINYLSLLGWSPGNNQEIISLKEMVEKFTLERVQSTGAIFNIQKMDWMNGEYLRAMPAPELKALFKKTLQAAGVSIEGHDEGWWDRFVELLKLRIFLIGDIVTQTGFFFADDVNWSDDDGKILRENPALGEAFAKYAVVLEKLQDFGHASIEAASREFMKANGLSGKQFIHPARIAITGRTVSPGFFETVSLVGKERSIKRLRSASEKLKAAV